MAIANVLTNEQLIRTPHGRVFVRHTPGEDPPFVLMHGFPDDHRIYDRLLSYLSPRQSVAFDFLGYGRSERTDIPRFSPEDHAVELTAVLDELGIERAVLVGHDASGPDAVFYAVTHPERVVHLVLLNTIFGHQPSLRMPEMTRLFSDPQLKTLADDMVSDPSQLLWLLGRWGRQLGLDADDPEGLVKTSVLPQFVGEADRPDALTSIRAWIELLPNSFSHQDALIDSGVLRTLRAPVSIIFGEEDHYLNPCLAAELSELFADPALHLLPGAGHWPQHDQPEAVAEILIRI
jgi:pimeloyl-ACP methyl ester carboxylesterase